MGIKEIKMEMGGMKRKDIITYFLDLAEVNGDDPIFFGDRWSVTIGEEIDTRLGSIVIPRTKVIFVGDENVLERTIYRFRLKFLSAGG